MDIAPELFEIAAAGHATPRSAEVEESDELLDAEGSCPAAAITVVPST